MKLFGRKRKPEQDGLGLPAGDEEAGPSGLGSTSVSVAPPTASTPLPTSGPSEPPAADNPIAQLQSLAGGMSTMGSGAALAQLLTGRGPVGELVKEIRSD